MSNQAQSAAIPVTRRVICVPWGGGSHQHGAGVILRLCLGHQQGSIHSCRRAVHQLDKAQRLCRPSTVKVAPLVTMPVLAILLLSDCHREVPTRGAITNVEHVLAHQVVLLLGAVDAVGQNAASLPPLTCLTLLESQAAKQHRALAIESRCWYNNKYNNKSAFQAGTCETSLVFPQQPVLPISIQSTNLSLTIMQRNIIGTRCWCLETILMEMQQIGV